MIPAQKSLKPQVHLSQTKCSFCQTQLDVHEAVRGVCSNVACQRRALIQSIAKNRAAKRAALLANARDYRAGIAASLGFTPAESLPMAIVPATRQPLRRLPESRKRLFRQHLSQVMRQTLAQIPIHADTPVPIDELPDAPQFNETPPALRLGCATCRGYCCRLGRTQAFIDPPTLIRVFRRHPGITPRAVQDLYLGRLPEQSVRWSCVFHGNNGCVLPRDLRADICNSYLCDGLKEIQTQLKQAPDRHLLIVAAADTHPVRSNFLPPS